MSTSKPKGAPVSTEIQPPGVSINADVHYAHLSVKKSFAGKNVLVTGATGFLGKCVVEKLLRSTDVGQLYVLVRPRKGSSASDRMFSEIIASPCFDRCRLEKPGFDAYARSKMVAVTGELTQQRLGIEPAMYQELQDKAHIIIHCAAVVDFNERLDRAVELNIYGSLRVLELAKLCKHLQAHIHISTCYVNSNRLEGGWVDEKLYPLKFDPQEMLEKIQKLNVSDLEKVTVTQTFGDWPNTYTFTKNIAEHMLVRNRGQVPMVILRPAIITGAAAEPQPGWVDVVSAAGAVVLSVALGVLHMLPAKPSRVADLVPVDYVVNSILMAVPAILNQDRYMVVHSSSSSESPTTWSQLRDITLPELQRRPRNKQAVQKRWFYFVDSPQRYQIEFFLRYSVPSSILSTLSLSGNEKLKQSADRFSKLLWRVRVITESFRPFVNYEWVFDNRTLRALSRALVEDEQATFPLALPASSMTWEEYYPIHLYGLCRFILQEDLIPMDIYQRRRNMDLVADDIAEAAARPKFRRFFGDVDWTLTRTAERPPYPPGRPIAAMQDIVLGSTEVRACIQSIASRTNKPVAKLEAEAKAILAKMVGITDLPVMQSFGWFLRKIWRKIYKRIEVDVEGLKKVQAEALKGPLVFMPTHRSYIDFLVISYLCFAAKLPFPYIASGEDFLGIILVRWVFRHSGAFFLRRTFAGDELYSTIFSRYVEQLLLDGQSIEFFIEGTRSRSGKMLHPKMGLLSIITQSFLDQKVKDITLVPVAITYERTIEQNLYSNELSGERKIRESLRNLLNSRHILNINFGRISLRFSDPISLKKYTQQHIARTEQQLIAAASEDPANKPLASGALYTFEPSPAAIAAGIKAREEATAAAVNGNAVSASHTAAQPGSSSLVTRYNPFTNKGDRPKFNQALAYEVSYELNRYTQCMPTHLVATLVLMYRQGITRNLLMEKIEWLRKEINARGGEVLGAETEHRVQIVEHALRHLGKLVVERRQNVIEPAISSRLEYNNMLALGHYRNKIVHLFFRESIWACAMYGLLAQSSSSPSAQQHHGVEKGPLLEAVRFLYSLLHLEFVIKADPNEPENFEASLADMVQRGVLQISEDGKRVEVASSGEVHYSFLCALLWPFIDSYYAATMLLFTLQPNRKLNEDTLLQRTQWLATTLYHESMLCFYESCSKETISNAFLLLQSWKIISMVKERVVGVKAKIRTAPDVGGQKTAIVITLLPPYQNEAPLNELLERIGRFRKPPPVQKDSKGGLRRNLVADIPILAKL